MRNYLVASLLLITVTSYTQDRIPVFRNSEDSATYFQIQKMFNPDSRAKVILAPTIAHLDSMRLAHDSLAAVQQTILMRSLVRWKYAYKADPDFTSLDDLLQKRVKPSNVSRLSIAGYKGKKLPKEIKACSQLKELELVNTSVERLQGLNKFRDLRAVYVYDNSSSKPLKLGRSKRITILKMEGNDPEKLPVTFKKFKNLDSLDLSKNSLTTFPSIHKNKKLKVLSLSDNLLTLNDADIRPNNYLERLYLRNNKITTVPAALSNLAALKEVSFAINEIENIEQGFERLKKLENISFYKNKLKTAPLYQLNSLKEIDLYFNQISAIGPAIANLQHLEILYLSHNHLSSLPEAVTQLPQLRELYAHHNLLTTLPQGIGDLEKLTVLRINHNIFSNFPSSLLQLDQLEVLDLGYNRLGMLPGPLPGLDKLQFLAITENPWNDKDEIVLISQALRQRGVNVHNNSLTNVVEDR